MFGKTVDGSDDLTVDHLRADFADINHLSIKDLTGTILTLSDGSTLTLTSTSLQASSTLTVEINGTPRLVLTPSRTTIYGDLYVTGKIVNTPTYSNYTPFFISQAGSLGTVAYSRQSGIYLQSGPLLVYQIELSGTATGSSVTSLSVSAPLSSEQTFGNTNILTTLDQPIYSSTSAQTFLLQNPERSTVPLPDATPFSFQSTGFYFTQPGTSFTPSFVVDSGTFTYSTQSGEWVQLGAATFFVAHLTGTYTSVNTTTLGITLPSTPAHPSVTTSLLSDENPLALLLQQNIFVNPTLGPVTLSGSGTLSRQITGWYLDNSALSFNPTFKAVGGTWTETNPVFQAYYTTLNSIVVCTLTYTAQVTAATSHLQLTGLPAPMTNNVSSQIVTSTNLPSPLTLVVDPSTGNLDLWNSATYSLASFNVTGTVTVTIALLYITQ